MTYKMKPIGRIDGDPKDMPEKIPAEALLKWAKKKMERLEAENAELREMLGNKVKSSMVIPKEKPLTKELRETYVKQIHDYQKKYEEQREANGALHRRINTLEKQLAEYASNQFGFDGGKE